MTVDFTSDFSWTDDNVIIWDGQDHQPLVLRGTGPNTPTITGYKAAVIENHSDGGLSVSNLTIKKGDVGSDNAIFGSNGNVALNNTTVLGRVGEDNGRAIPRGKRRRLDYQQHYPGQRDGRGSGNLRWRGTLRHSD